MFYSLINKQASFAVAVHFGSRFCCGIMFFPIRMGLITTYNLFPPSVFTSMLALLRALGSNPSTFCALIRLFCVPQLWFVGSFLLFAGFSLISVYAGKLASLSCVRQQQVVCKFGFHYNQWSCWSSVNFNQLFISTQHSSD